LIECHAPSHKKCGDAGVNEAEIGPLPASTENDIDPFFSSNIKKFFLFVCTDISIPSMLLGFMSMVISISLRTTNFSTET